MKASHRHWRAVRRGRLNPATFDARNRKSQREFDRWWSERMFYRVKVDGMLCWQFVPTGRGLIHKGRKP